MALSPLTPTIYNTQTRVFRSTINNAIWSITSGAGSLGAGGDSYERTFVPAGNGVSTVQAQVSVWRSAYPARNTTTDALEFTSTIITSQYLTIDLIILEGEEIVITIETNSGGAGNIYACRTSNGHVYFIDRGANTYYNHTGTTFSIGTVNAGDIFKWKMIDAGGLNDPDGNPVTAGQKRLAFYKWNGATWDLKGFSMTNYTLPLTGSDKFYFYIETAAYNGLTVPAPTTNSSLLTTESTNITVVEPGTERVSFSLIG